MERKIHVIGKGKAHGEIAIEYFHDEKATLQTWSLPQFPKFNLETKIKEGAMKTAKSPYPY